ncbi:MAG TPA: HAD family hydrolase, partial [Nitrospirota bacterium]|nr:HAD family hydrolase [Nitrospirota bacterium]
ADLRLIPGAGAAIKRLNESGLKVVLVTNQSGIARGYFSESLLHEIHARLEQMLRDEGARLDAIYYCPHHPTAGNSDYTKECDCRKPRTGLINRAARDLEIDVKRSFVVGDKWSDVELGRRAGAHAILVRTGYGSRDEESVRPPYLFQPDFIAHTISEAADWIINQVGKNDG